VAAACAEAREGYLAGERHGGGHVFLVEHFRDDQPGDGAQADLEEEDEEHDLQGGREGGGEGGGEERSRAVGSRIRMDKVSRENSGRHRTCKRTNESWKTPFLPPSLLSPLPPSLPPYPQQGHHIRHHMV